MPYLSPTSSTTTAATEDLTNEQARPSHRRTRSSTPTFSTETGPGAFTPLVGLPRRQRQFEKRTQFQIAPDDEDETESAPPPRQNGKVEPVPKPQIEISLPPTSPAANAIPFPSSSGAAVESSIQFPSLDPPATPGSPSRASSISRSGSTPIVLANGKTLKPSLKSSVSSPQIVDWRAQHPRSRSEPSTPLIPKTVHFPERKDTLENVVLFEKTARPRAVSGNADDTETETEGYDSPANAAILAGNSSKGFPFGEQSPQQFGLEIDTEKSSTVPLIEPGIFSNIHVETLVFPRTRPPTLRGSILVKNVAFEKAVALRFTLDNWQTTSEVVCRHVCTLPSLPSPFPPERVSVGSPQLTWDRFSFTVRLEDVERKLAERTIFFVARFSAAGVGEWWDNNNGANYKLVFRKAVGGTNTPPARAASPSPLRFVDAPKKMFPGLDLRPITMSLPSSDPEIPPLRLKKPFSPSSSPPKSAPSAPSTSNVNAVVAPPPPAHQRSTSASSLASSGSSGSLRLSNYASPTSPVPVNGGSQRNSISMVFGPLVGGQPISLPPTPAALEVPTSRGGPGGAGGSPTPRRSPTNSFVATPSTTSSITPTPTSIGAPFTPLSPNKTPPANGTTNGSSFPFSSTDDTYAALVEKWCFHQSPAPSKDASPSSEMSTPGLGVPAGSMSMGGGNGVTNGFESAAAGYGSAYGYGHHRNLLGKPLSLKP